jgi:hypothetical protein
LGDGDRQVLEAVGELRKLKAEGIVKAVGISGQFIFDFISATPGPDHISS